MAETQVTRESRETEQRRFSRRLVVLTVLLCLLFGALGHRAFDLQVRRSAKFRQMIEVSQYLTLRLPAKRGDIFARDMTPLAISVEVDSLYTNPRVVQNKALMARRLAPVLGLTPKKLMYYLLQDRYFVWLKRHVSRRQMRAVRRLSFGQELRIVQERKRFYPNRSLGAHILGYTDRDGRGLAGVEHFFDRLLRGKKRSIRLPHDPKGRHILNPKKLSFSGGAGASVVLTIDKTIQYITEAALKEASIKFKVKRGIAVVMDPNNGDLLALAVYPTFDTNAFRKVTVGKRNNAAVSNPYEPGSTMKIISLAIARHLNVYRKGEVLNCENGRMRIGRYTIRDDHPFRSLTVPGVMQHSSNICTAKLAMRVGKQRLHDYYRAFGFGQKTDIGLPGESRGILHPARKWANISLANIAFGQGVAVTPLQLTAAVSAVANGGTYFKPRLYRSIIDGKGRTIRKLPPRRVARVISRAAAKDTISMMVKVVDEGTGKNAAIRGIKVAGKTGTAQKPRANGRGYGKGRIGSFIGFLPAENPRLTILVVMDEPVGSKYGGTVAAPAWKKIALGSMQHLGELAADKLQFRQIAKAAAVDDAGKGKDPKAAKAAKAVKAAKGVKLAQDPKVAKRAKVPTRLAKAAQPQRAADLVPQAKPNRSQVPNFLGLSLKAAKQRARSLGITLNTIGSGNARFQKPSVGARLSGRKVTVIFTSSN